MNNKLQIISQLSINIDRNQFKITMVCSVTLNLNTMPIPLF